MENYTKTQLQAVATQKGIKFNSKTTRSELAAAIEKSSKTAPKAKAGNTFEGEY